jgi:hypothetical protein
VCGRSRRVDVIHQQNRAPKGLGGKRARNISAPLEEREPALPARPANSREERFARQLPDRRERTGELLRGVISALEAAFAVRRNERDEIDVGARQALGDDAGRFGAEAAEPALLPAAHDPADV